MSQIPTLALEVKSVAVFIHTAVSRSPFATQAIDICHRAADEIAALTAEREELLEALRQIAYRTGDVALPEAVAQETMRGLW